MLFLIIILQGRFLLTKYEEIGNFTFVGQFLKITVSAGLLTQQMVEQCLVKTKKFLKTVLLMKTK